jgi:DNA (cytosine-5)-methyltransferase 1
MKLNVATDFSGVGAPELALNRLGIEYNLVFACEKDKFARKSYLSLHNPKYFFDDITTRSIPSDIPPIDLYFGGFPCQPFSVAGKRHGFSDTRGTLFHNLVDSINKTKPKVFVLENVKGLLSHDKGNTFKTVLHTLEGEGYNIHYKVLNTKDFGLPQNRERVFIVGFKEFRLFNFPTGFPLTTTIKDVLEADVDSKYYLSEKMVKGFSKHNDNHKEKGTGFLWSPKEMDDIANCLRANGSLCPTDNTIITHSLFPRSSKTGKGGSGHLSKEDGLSYCLDTQNTQAIEFKGAALRNRGEGKQLEVRKDDVCNSLTTAKEDSLVFKNKVRRLTPLECFRLQGFTDKEFNKMLPTNSNTQLYKQAGNTISIPVLSAIIRNIYYG